MRTLTTSNTDTASPGGAAPATRAATTRGGMRSKDTSPPTSWPDSWPPPPVDARALRVPGMPVGSPGMEMGERFQPYDVLLIRRDGSVEVYETVSNQAQQYARGK